MKFNFWMRGIPRKKSYAFFFVTMQKELGSSRPYVPLKFLSIRIFFLFLHPADKKATFHSGMGMEVAETHTGISFMFGFVEREKSG